jgi:hypothetical protein
VLVIYAVKLDFFKKTLGLYRTGSKWPDVKETTKDWEAHSEKLAAAKEALRKGREPLSLPVSHTLHCKLHS